MLISHDSLSNEELGSKLCSKSNTNKEIKTDFSKFFFFCVCVFSPNRMVQSIFLFLVTRLPGNKTYHYLRKLLLLVCIYQTHSCLKTNLVINIAFGETIKPYYNIMSQGIFKARLYFRDYKQLHGLPGSLASARHARFIPQCWNALHDYRNVTYAVFIIYPLSTKTDRGVFQSITN